MRVGLTFEAAKPQEAAFRYVDLLAAELKHARPSFIQVDGTRIRLRAGLFRFVGSWNLLVAVTSAEISVEPGDGRVEVLLHARLTQLILFCLFATFFFFQATRHWQNGPGTGSIVLLVWGWLFGMNFLITRVRLVLLLRRVASAAARPTSAG